jgi:hypothetical protein
VLPTSVLFKEFSTVEDDAPGPNADTVAQTGGLIYHLLDSVNDACEIKLQSFDCVFDVSLGCMCVSCGNAAPSSFQPTRVMSKCEGNGWKPESVFEVWPEGRMQPKTERERANSSDLCLRCLQSLNTVLQGLNE